MEELKTVTAELDNEEFGAAELLDNALLLEIRHASVKILDGLLRELQVLQEMFLQPLHGSDSLCEDDHTVILSRRIPGILIALQELQETDISAEVLRTDPLQGGQEFLQGRPLLMRCVGVISFVTSASASQAQEPAHAKIFLALISMIAIVISSCSQ